MDIDCMARLSNFCKQRSEALSLGRPVGNCPLRVSVLDDSVWDTNCQYVFDQDAVGQNLGDVSVAGTRPRTAGGFQLDRDDAMAGVDQVIWPSGEPIPV